MKTRIIDLAHIHGPLAARRWTRVVMATGLFAFAALTFELGCGDTLGSSCTDDSECSDGQVCASPACVSSDLVCLYPCNSDGDCVAEAGTGSTCTKDPLGVGCIGYCSAAD